MSTYNRPTTSYAPTTTSTNINKYANDSAGAVAISSLKVDADINYVIDALNTLVLGAYPTVSGKALLPLRVNSGATGVEWAALGTTAIADTSITTAKLDTAILNGFSTETSLQSGDKFAFSDISASNANKNVTLGNIATTLRTLAFGGAWVATLASNQTINNSATGTFILGTEVYDTDGVYDSTTGIATPTKAGYYLVFGGVAAPSALSGGTNLYFGKNGTSTERYYRADHGGTGAFFMDIIPVNGSSDTLRMCFTNGTGGNLTFTSPNSGTFFGGIWLGNF
jgi:hypothetical protein